MIIPRCYLHVGNNKDKMHVSNNRKVVILRWFTLHSVLN